MTGRLLLQRGLEGLGLTGISEPAATDLLWLLEELQRWNRHHNLTAIVDQPSAIEKHLLDSLTLLRLLTGTERLLDIGSGAGFPGLPLKIVRPGLELVSIDGVAKKIRFQNHVIRQLGLTGVSASACRIEDLARDRESTGTFAVIVFRALGRLERFVPLALPCLADQGRFLVMKGPEGRDELEAAEPLLRELGLGCLQLHELTLPGTGSARTILEIGRNSIQI
jgi:16S rRNA (guanine527-N7)-methyltransferase